MLVAAHTASALLHFLPCDACSANLSRQIRGHHPRITCCRTGPGGQVEKMIPPIKLAERLALLVALDLFLGLAFEDIYKRDEPAIPGGIRTFPLVGLAGARLRTRTHRLCRAVGLRRSVPPIAARTACRERTDIGPYWLLYASTRNAALSSAGILNQPSESWFTLSATRPNFTCVTLKSLK